MTPEQDYAEFLRRMYHARACHNRKLRNIMRFLSAYAIIGAIVLAAIAIIMNY